jgi:hypothetical protein
LQSAARSPAQQSVALHFRFAMTLEGNATSFQAKLEVDQCFDLGRFPGTAPDAHPPWLVPESVCLEYVGHRSLLDHSAPVTSGVRWLSQLKSLITGRV